MEADKTLETLRGARADLQAIADGAGDEQTRATARKVIGVIDVVGRLLSESTKESGEKLTVWDAAKSALSPDDYNRVRGVVRLVGVHAPLILDKRRGGKDSAQTQTVVGAIVSKMAAVDLRSWQAHLGGSEKAEKQG